jgi:hypothetical protein
MRSLIANYYHRRSLRLDNDSKQSKQEAFKNIKSSESTNINDSSSSSSAAAAAAVVNMVNKQDRDEDEDIMSQQQVSNEENTHLPFDLNIKFIDDADTDVSIISQSDCDEDSINTTTNKIQKNSKLYILLFFSPIIDLIIRTNKYQFIKFFVINFSYFDTPYTIKVTLLIYLYLL